MPLRNTSMIKTVLVVTLFAFSTICANAVEWSECEGGISRVTGAAELANRYISSMRTIEAELASSKLEYDNCIKDPEKYGSGSDACQDQRHEYEERRDRYETDSSDFNNELNNLDAGVKSVLETCR